MRIVKPAFTIEDDILGTDYEARMKLIEKLTRRCYKSEGKATEDSWREFVPRVFNTNKHRGIIEHVTITVSIYSDRGVSHELVRHRIASYLQESTRYVNYEKKGMTVIMPPFLNKILPPFKKWVKHLKGVERQYNELISDGWKPQEARSILPNALKAEVGVTMNLRSWYNFFELRTAVTAHPQIRQISVPLLKEFIKRFPGIFDDIQVPELPFAEAIMISDESQLEEVPIQ